MLNAESFPKNNNSKQTTLFDKRLPALSRAVACLFFVTCLSLTGRTNFAQDDNILLIDDFEQVVQNQLNGYRNSYNKLPSQAQIARVKSSLSSDKNQSGSANHALRIKGQKALKGWCGAWVHLFDYKQPSKRYLNASSFDYLSFLIKGQLGGERVVVKLADEYWYKLEDSWPVAHSDRALPQGISREWQEIRIPLSHIRRTNSEKLASLVFEFSDPGEHLIFVDNICLKTEAGLEVSVQRLVDKSISATLRSPSNQIASTHKNPAPPRSLWVWKTADLLNNSVARQELFDFCRQRNIQSLWMQMLYQMEERQCRIPLAAQFRRFNAEANARGIQVHALDGYPEYALKELQHVPIALVKAIVAFNRSSREAERFTGVHFDNEPHLLVGWHSPRHRKQILREFLELNQTCQELARDGGLKYGIDIPFWWEETDPLTGEPCGMVHFNGANKPASFHCIDLLDNVGVMNYRDTADGADGMIAHGRDLLNYADAQSQCEIYMGVETFAYPLQTVEFLIGIPRERFYQLMDGPAARLGRLSRIHNYRLRVFDDGKNIHVGLEHPEKADAFNHRTYKSALSQIANQLQLGSEFKQEAYLNFAKALTRSGEYKEPKLYHPYLSGRLIHGVKVTAFMSPKITFANQSIRDFEFETGLADDYFVRYGSYYGIAIHCYDAILKLQDEKADRTRQTTGMKEANYETPLPQ